MRWALAIGAAVTPVGQATSSVVDYVLSYGVLGLFVLTLAWLTYRGWRIVSPATMKAERDEARADLVAENARLISEKHQAEEQRDAAMKLASDQIVPLLLSFTSATNSLLPLLQDLVRREEDRRRNGGNGGSRGAGT